MKANKILVRILTPFIALCLALAPMQSYAFVPAAVGGYGLPTLPTTGTYATASGSAPIAVGAAAFAIGMAIGYYGLEYLLGDGTPQHVRIPLTTDPTKAVPAPSAPSSASQVQMYCTTSSGCSTGTKYSTAAAACNAYKDTGYSNGYMYGVWVSSGSYCSTWFHYNSGGDSQVGSINIYSSAPTCPTGYVLSGSSCVLSDARAVTPDNSCDFVRSGTTLSAASPNDPDCQAALLKMPLVCANGTCSGQGLDSNGNPQNYLITPRSDGGSTIKTQSQKTVNGQTQIQTTTVGVSPAGVVDGVSGDVQPGSIPVSTDGSATTPATTTSPLQSPSGSATFPTDYARTGEAAAAAQSVTTAVQAQTAADQAWRDGEQARKDAEKGTIPSADPIPKQTVNISYSPLSFTSNAVCPAPITFNLYNHDYSISYDPLCNVMSYMRPIFLAAGALAAAAIFIGGLKT